MDNSVSIIYSKLIDILRNSSLKNYFARKISDLNERANKKSDDVIKLGVIGVTSSGKSTLVNCIIGEKLLPMVGRPSSSQLVTCRKGTQKKAVICFDDTSFFGKNEETIIGRKVTAENLAKYCDESGNAQNKKHVNHIYLETDRFDFPENLQLIDSPGLDAYGLENHEKLTMATLLPTVDFCILVTTCKANSDAKTKSCINEFARYDKPLIIVQNMADSIRASLDGKKSVEDVARELIMRTRRIVDCSSFTDKQSVKIVQISAKLALDYRTGQPTATKDFEKSNYAELRKIINQTVNDFLPKILNGKFALLSHTISDIFNDCNNEIQNLERQNNSIKNISFNKEFPYEKEVFRLGRTRTKQTKDFMKYIGGVIQSLNDYVNNCGNVGQSELNYVNNQLSELVNTVADKIKEVNDLFSEKLDEFGLDKRNVFSEIYIPQSASLSSRKYTYEKPVYRACGCVKYYEKVTETDYTANKQAALNSINGWYGAFGKTLSQLDSQIELVISKVSEEVERRRKEFDQQNAVATKMLNDKANLLRNIDEFKAIIKKLEALKKDIPHAEVKTSIPDDKVGKPQEEVEQEISNDTLAAYKLSQRIIQGIHRSTFNILMDKLGKGNSLVVGWDKNMMDDFVYNTFGDGNVKTVVNPSANWRPQNVRNLFVMLNVTQIGQAESQFARNNIYQYQYGNIILVAQDFREFASSLSEYLPYLKVEFAKKFGLRNCYYLFNDNNPLINMAAILSQTGDIKTQTDEAEFIALVRRHHSALASEQIVEYISKIIRTTK